jgi:hypothetical protein
LTGKPQCPNIGAECLAFCKTTYALVNALLSYIDAAERDIAIRQRAALMKRTVGRGMAAVAYSAGAERSPAGRYTLEMTPMILMVDHPAPLPWALLSTATVGSVHPCHANQDALQRRRIGRARAASTPKAVTMQDLACFHIGCLSSADCRRRCLDAFSTSIARAGLHRRRLRGTCVVSWTSMKS